MLQVTNRHHTSIMAIIRAQQKSLPQLCAMFVYLVSASSIARSTPHNSSEIDRLALLCLRSEFSEPNGAFDSWRNESYTFCGWHGVSCSTRHVARVVALNLAWHNITGQISPCIGDLHFLNRIDMAHNRISGHIPQEIGRLIRLKYLNLSTNSITGVIPDAISSCSRLKVIRLMNNSIEGKIPPSLAQLRLLQEITLSNNNLHGTIPPGIGMLPYLKFLFLPNNHLEGSIPEYLGNSRSLSMVALYSNNLIGGVPSLLANCSSLYYLKLTKNKLSGKIPPALFHGPSLVKLDLAYNNFSGSIPSSIMISSTLELVSLTGNNLSGDIPATLGNFSSLSILLLAKNNFQGIIPENLSMIPRLQVLDLAHNNLSGTVPLKLYRMASLTYLGLGDNQLVGRLPSNIGYTLPNIQTLIMEDNKFGGPLPVSLVNASDLEALALRDNAFTGVVPPYWSLPNLIQLDLGANQLEAIDWSSLSPMVNSTQIQSIYLDNNRIHGMLPKSIGYLSGSIEMLFLTENDLTGTIPSEIGNLTNLTILQLEGNELSGRIPDTLGNHGKLFVINLSQNRLSGEIPESIGNNERLSELYLHENNLSGSITPGISGCRNLVMLNLSYNAFQGSIPHELLTLSSLSKGLDLSYNKLTGSISSNIGGLTNLGSLVISNNQLSGEIPHTLGACIHLETIRLEVNLFSGSIPSSFISLRGVTDMDLSHNNLSGEIPNFLETFSTLRYLNLSFNNFEGNIPTGGAFSNSCNVFLQGNKKLCANRPMLELPLCIPILPKRTKKSYIILMIVIPVTIVVVVLSACVAIIVFKKRNPTKHMDQSCSEFNLSYSDLCKATNEFSSANLVGSGRFGMVYKGTIEFDTHPIAVKVFNLDQIGAPKSFFSECDVLRNTRHRNLIRVISLCSSLDQNGNEFKALILEYMGNGNLQSWIQSNFHTPINTRRLNLGSMILIAVDIAAALDYLHNSCVPPVVHCDLKPSNVLLDEDMVAHVSDFGLAKFLYERSSPMLDSSANTGGPRGSVGYIAPEYGMGCRISTAGDIYSYGIILLEMLTGKHPTDGMFKDGLTLHKIVDSAFPQDIDEILESNLITCYNTDEIADDSSNENQSIAGIRCCIIQLAKLGLSCSADLPNDRPATKDVYSEMITIRDTYSALQN